MHSEAFERKKEPDAMAAVLIVQEDVQAVQSRREGVHISTQTESRVRTEESIDRTPADCIN